MKKILTALLLVLPLTAIAEDYYKVNAPEWKDFAPTAFVDVKEPKGIMSKINVTAAYWHQRRVDFEAGVAECETYANNDEQFTCFEQLKIKQFKENTDYNARLEAKQQSYAMQEMNNMQGNMLPINNYLQNIGKFQANEFR